MLTTRQSRRWSQNGGYEGLESAVLPQARNGKLDIGNVGDAVEVRVPRYTDYRISDSFVVLLDGAPAPGVPPPDVPRNGDIPLMVPARAFSNGPVAVRYGVTDAAGNGALSPPTQIDVSGADGAWLPPPLFPDFPAGVAGFRAVALAGGVTVRAPAASLGEGDGITIIWEGYTDVWTPVPDMTRVLLSRPVTAADLAVGYVDAFARMADVLAAGDGGHCIARYIVERSGAVSGEARAAVAPDCAPRGHAGPVGQAFAGVGAAGGASGVTGVSRPALLLLDAGEPFILVGATSGAPFRTPDKPYLLPANRVWVATLPFRAITLSVDQGVAFSANDSGDLSLVTNAAGLAAVDIYKIQKGGSPTPILCYVSVADDGTDAVAGATSNFAGRYEVDQTGLTSYGCRKTAIAGANDACQISVSLPYNVTTVKVAASGSALVNGYGETATTLAHSDYSCTISITNEAAETAVITLDQPGYCEANIEIDFIYSPFSQ